MGACSSASLATVEVFCIRVSRQNHCADAEVDAIIRIRDELVKQLVDGVIGCFSGRGLLFA